jgi:mannose-1-phosphate guanylyltransferase
MSSLGILAARPGAPSNPADREATPPWAIVLAGGEGQRLRSLTRFVCGDDRPKQFAPLLGERSLLRHTLDRIGLRIPLSRTLVVTHARDAVYLDQEFARDEQRPECLVQPEDRGTATAILWAAHTIARRDPDAVAVVFPSDHYMEGEAEFMGHVLEVASFVRRHPKQHVLLGALASEADPQYGWIEAGEPIGHLRTGTVYRVRRFWEKPTAAEARVCLDAGALWNTFVLASRVATLGAVGEEALPGLSAGLARLAACAGAPEETRAIREAFALAPRANFSREVLERVPTGLAVSPLSSAVTWADWGTPERVIATLRRVGLRPRWLQAIGTCLCGLPEESAAPRERRSRSESE